MCSNSRPTHTTRLWPRLNNSTIMALLHLTNILVLLTPHSSSSSNRPLLWPNNMVSTPKPKQLSSTHSTARLLRLSPSRFTSLTLRPTRPRGSTQRRSSSMEGWLRSKSLSLPCTRWQRNRPRHPSPRLPHPQRPPRVCMPLPPISSRPQLPTLRADLQGGPSSSSNSRRRSLSSRPP